METKLSRKIYGSLIKWKEAPSRNPLILDGARQVGKTWIVEEFGAEEFSGMVKVDFKKTSEANSFFEDTLDPSIIIPRLESFTGKNITPGKTLLFFDEIQDSPRVVASMKYFSSDRPDLHLIGAGSMLGLKIRGNEPFPVGKVDLLRLRPLDFIEFLDAMEKSEMKELLETGTPQQIDSLHDDFCSMLRVYLYTGGMPAVVRTFVETFSFDAARQKQKDLLAQYRADAPKYAEPELVPKIHAVWDSIPAQIMKEHSNRFHYSRINENGGRSERRKRTYGDAVQWLVDAGSVNRVCIVNPLSAPLSSNADESIFKLYPLDCGLLGAMYDSSAEDILSQGGRFDSYKRALTETYVLEQILSSGRIDNAYYYGSKDNEHIEIDFVIEINGNEVPIEVKSGTRVESASLGAYLRKNPDAIAVRTSLRHFGQTDRIVSVPLYNIGAWIARMSRKESESPIVKQVENMLRNGDIPGKA